MVKMKAITLADTISGVKMSAKKCSYCGKKFPYHERNPYQRRYFISGSRKKAFCSYGCMRKNDKEQMDKDRSREIKGKAIVFVDGKPEYESCGEIHKNETRSMIEWAVKFNADYKRFWELVTIEGFYVIDALQMASK